MSRSLRFYGALAGVAAILAGAAAPAAAAVGDFFGSWYAAAPDPRGITRIDVRRLGDQVMVHVWGRCHPTDCDWGQAPGQPYAPRVDAPLWPTADVITADFDDGAEHTTVLLRTAGGAVNYQAFTHFSDSSHRSDYRQYGRLDR